MTINYFQIFGLEEKYSIDKNELENAYFLLQARFHPDRAAGKSEAEIMALMQKSSDINKGYMLLCDDVKRAEHLLELKNIFVNKEKDNTFTPNQEVLLEQMELRERIENKKNDKAALGEILKDLERKIIFIENNFKKSFEENNFEIAAQQAIKLKYFSKAIEAIDAN